MAVNPLTGSKYSYGLDLMVALRDDPTDALARYYEQRPVEIL